MKKNTCISRPNSNIKLYFVISLAATINATGYTNIPNSNANLNSSSTSNSYGKILAEEIMDETEYLMSSKKNHKLLLSAIQELESGKGKKFSLKELENEYTKKLS